MKRMIHGVTPLQKGWDDPTVPQVEMYHTCARYKDTLKGVFCQFCKNKEYNNKKKLAKVLVTKIGTQ